MPNSVENFTGNNSEGRGDHLPAFTRQLASVGAASDSRLPAVFLAGPDRGRRFWEIFHSQHPK